MCHGVAGIIRACERRVQGLGVVTHRWAHGDFSICTRRMHLRLFEGPFACTPVSD